MCLASARGFEARERWRKERRRREVEGGGARVLRVFAGLRLIEEKVAKSLKLEEEEKKRVAG